MKCQKRAEDDDDDDVEATGVLMRWLGLILTEKRMKEKSDLTS